MKELLEEVKSKRYNCLVERQKRQHDYPFMNECDHLYRLLMAQCKLETWRQCENFLVKFYINREQKELDLRGAEFEERIQMELNRIPGYLTQNTKAELFEYIKLLEWKVQQRNQ